MWWRRCNWSGSSCGCCTWCTSIERCLSRIGVPSARGGHVIQFESIALPKLSNPGCSALGFQDLAEVGRIRSDCCWKSSPTTAFYGHPRRRWHISTQPCGRHGIAEQLCVRPRQHRVTLATSGGKRHGRDAASRIQDLLESVVLLPQLPPFDNACRFRASVKHRLRPHAFVPSCKRQ
jgi:hypothetical protein